MTEGGREADRGLYALGRGSSLNLLGAGCRTLLTLALIVVVTRGYGQVDAGVFFAATALFLLVGQAAEIGAEEALVRFVPAFRATGRSGDVPSLLRHALRPVVVAAGAASLMTLAFAPVLAGAVSDADVDDLTRIVWVIVPFIPFVSISEVALAATRGFQTMRPSVVIYDVALPVVQLALAVSVRIVFPTSVAALVASYAIPYVASAWWAMRALRQLVADDADVPTTGGGVTGYWRFTLPRAVARIAQYALNRIDVLLVATLAGPQEAAVYTSVSRFVTVGAVGVQAVQQVAQPRLGELLELGDRGRALEVFRTTTVWLMMGSWPIYVLLAIYAPVVLRAFGDSYVRGTAALIILCCAQLVTVATGPVDIALVMSGRSALSLVNQVVALIVDIVGCVVLVPHVGATGAALAKAFARLAGNLAPAVQVRRRLGLEPFCAGFLAVVLGAAVVAGIALLARLALGATVTALVVSLVATGVAYALFLHRRRGPLQLDALLRGVTVRLPGV